MRCNFTCLVAAAAIAVGAAAGSAWAQPSNPFNPSEDVLQSLTVDRTGDFSGNTQASMATVENIDGGLKANIHWSTGDSLSNEGFTRIVLTQQYDGDFGGDGDRGDLDGFNGVKWCVSSTIDVTLKPYTQVGGTFAFFEGTQPGTGDPEDPEQVGTFFIPGDGQQHMVWIDWDMVGGGPIPAGSPGGRDDIFEHGFQIFGPGLAQDTGDSVDSMFTITRWVPEPASMALVGLGVALLGMVRRRK